MRPFLRTAISAFAPAALAMILAGSLPGALGAQGYAPGETLRYHIKWGLITAGEARMEVREAALPDGRRVHRFVSAARGTTFMDRIFPVRNRIESLFDPVRRRTLYNSKKIREGGYHRQYEVNFDHRLRRAVFQQRERSGEGAEWKERAGISEDLPENFQDMLTAIYYNRSHGRAGQPGDSFTLPVYDDRKIGRLKMEILERETLALEINDRRQEVSALRVRPLIQTSGLFRSKGQTVLYISDDERRLILRVDATVPKAGDVKLLLFRTDGVPGF